MYCIIIFNTIFIYINEGSNLDNQLYNLLYSILQKTIPNKLKMKRLIEIEESKAIDEVSKTSGAYKLSKNLVDSFLITADLTTEELKDFAEFLPGGFVASNPFYNMLVIYILTFCINGEKDEIVYKVSRYYTAITASYMKIKYIPIIDESLLNYTLANAHGATVAKQGFGAMVIKMADETLDKYLPDFQKGGSINSYYRYIVDIHNKVNQSMKHLARRYYKNAELGKAVTEDISDLVDKAMEQIPSVTMNEKVIEYISDKANVSEIDVENICSKIHDSNDMESGMQNLIVKFIYHFRTKEKINEVGLVAAAGRCMIMNETKELATVVLDEVEVEPTNDNVKVVVYLALLTIMFS